MYYYLKIFFIVILINSNFLIPAFSQVVHENKEVIKAEQGKVKKDTSIYKIVLSNKDTMIYGDNKKAVITDGNRFLTVVFERKQNICLIHFINEKKKILSIQAIIKRTKKDTIQVYSPDLLTEPEYLKFQNTLYCDISSIQVQDYGSASSYVYIRRMIGKLF
jgi:hypothetical protein